MALDVIRSMPPADQLCECYQAHVPEWPGQHTPIPAPSGWPHSHPPKDYPLHRCP